MLGGTVVCSCIHVLQPLQCGGCALVHCRGDAAFPGPTFPALFPNLVAKFANSFRLVNTCDSLASLQIFIDQNTLATYKINAVTLRAVIVL